MAGESQQPPATAPDPSTLTTDQLLRATSAERDYVDGQIRVLEERLRAIDKATELLNVNVNRVPTTLGDAIRHLRELMDERFSSISLQFAERDTRSERESKDNKVAVDAAFAAQKEAAAKQDEGNAKAIDKSEKATAETIKTNAELVRAGLQALADNLADVKERVASIESARLGASAQRDEGRAHVSTTTAVIGSVIGVVLFVVTLYALTKGTPATFT